MSAPVRIQLRRTKGWRKPPNTVVVARPSLFGNPFTIKSAMEAGYVLSEEEPLARQFVVDVFRDWLADRGTYWQSDQADKRRADFLARLPALRGKNLACWCPLNQPCHADVLLELANRPRP